MTPPVLVTGGAGFIGHHLVRALLARGERVRVLDDLSTGQLDRLPDDPRLELVVGDVRDPVRVGQVSRGVARGWHLAGVGSVRGASAAEVFSVNVEGTQQVLAAAEGPVVLASSAAVYGDRAVACVEGSPCRPVSAYGASKLAAESRAAGAVILRLFNVYGSGQATRGASAGVVSRFLAAARAGSPVRVFGDGRQARDFVHIDDIVGALLRAPELPAGVFNVGSGVATTVLELLDLIRQITGSPLVSLHSLAPGAEVRFSLADTTRARARLGLDSVTPLARGLVTSYVRPAQGASAVGGWTRRKLDRERGAVAIDAL